MQLTKEIFNNSDEINLIGKTAVITGASSGIGLATAGWLAREGMNLILIARRIDKLDLLKKELNELFPKVSIKNLQIDLQEKNLLEKLTNENVFNCDLFINNAGLALTRDLVENSNEEDIEIMVNTNITALFKLCSVAAKNMVKLGGGHIINLGSVAGHYSYPGGAVYCATKSAVKAFSEALRQELHEKNVRVSLISPGMVRTDFSLVRFKGDKSTAENVYAHVDCLEAKDIARIIVKTAKEPFHVNIDEVLVFPTVQAPVSLKAIKNK
ncbi:SDR family NAD(P)-dependent oxidoreductase [Pigmentibacter ruber]